jgi:hypothetical protein
VFGCLESVLGCGVSPFWGSAFALATKCGLSEKQPACEHVIPLALTVRVGMHCPVVPWSNCAPLHKQPPVFGRIEDWGFGGKSLVLGVWWGVAIPFPCPCAWELERISLCLWSQFVGKLGHFCVS